MTGFSYLRFSVPGFSPRFLPNRQSAGGRGFLRMTGFSYLRFSFPGFSPRFFLPVSSYQPQTSSLHAASADAFGKGFEFGKGHAVPIAGDGVFPCAGGGGEIDGVVGFVAAQHGED